MEKIKLDPFISELLFEHDCVIIADLGGFVANYKPSILHPAHHTLTPPSKKIAFNSSLKINDGLLASYIAEMYSLTYQEACNRIARYVDESLNYMETGKKLHIEKIGSLFYNTEKKLQFAPDNSTNYLLDSFGLATVHSPTIRREVPVRKILTKQPDTRRMEAGSRPGKSRFSWRWIELIPAAAVLVLLFLNPVIIRNLSNNVAGLLPEMQLRNPFKLSGQVPRQEPTEVIGFSTVTTDTFSTESAPVLTDSSAWQPVPVSTETAAHEPVADADSAATTGYDVAAVEKSNTIASTATQPVTESTGFFIVAGCFKIEDNAKQLHADLISKGYPSELIGKYKGLHVVTFQHAGSEEEAKEMLLKIKASQQEAWVLKK